MDNFEQLIQLFVNNGTAIAVIIYFMFRDYKFMDNLTKTVASLNATLQELQELTRKVGIEDDKTKD